MIWKERKDDNGQNWTGPQIFLSHLDLRRGLINIPWNSGLSNKGRWPFIYLFLSFFEQYISLEKRKYNTFFHQLRKLNLWNTTVKTGKQLCFTKRSWLPMIAHISCISFTWNSLYYSKQIALLENHFYLNPILFPCK